MPFTVKILGEHPDEELLIAASAVRRAGSRLIYFNEHDVEVEMTALEGRTAYVMNQGGATVARYRF